jgi:predicted aspartyl protease
MGLFKTKVRIAIVAGPTITLGEELELLVDSGATYSMLPGTVLARHGVRRLGKIKLKLANGRTVYKSYGGVFLKLDGKIVPTTVLFGEGPDVPLLGATTLEQASLGVDPVGKKLIPVQAIQAACAPARVKPVHP